MVQLGVFPVFVVDGDPPALKSPARMVRFNRMTGVDFLSSQKAECINLERNPVFNRSVEECVVSVALYLRNSLFIFAEVIYGCIWWFLYYMIKCFCTSYSLYNVLFYKLAGEGMPFFGQH
jgi:hypothetical protein